MNNPFWLLPLFLLTGLLGIYTGWHMIPVVGEINPLTDSSVNDPQGGLYMLAIIFLSTIVLLVVLKFYKGRLLFRILEAYIVFVGSMIFWEFAILDVMGISTAQGAGGEEAGYVIVFLLMAVLTTTIRFIGGNLSKNLSLSIAIGGAGGSLGSFLGLAPSLIIIAVMCIYDVIAVFKTKHMVELAMLSREKHLPVMFELEGKPKKGSRHTRKRVGMKKEDGGGRGVCLGTGDVALPIILFVALARSFSSWIVPIVALGGAVVGLGGVVYYTRYIRRVPLPALPPIIGPALIAGIAAGFFL